MQTQGRGEASRGRGFQRPEEECLKAAMQYGFRVGTQRVCMLILSATHIPGCIQALLITARTQLNLVQ